MGISDQTYDVFMDDCFFYRRINSGYENDIRLLFECGLIDELLRRGLIPKTEILIDSEGCGGLVVRQDRIELITYPFEWSPEQLRQAGTCTLDVNDVANSFGYELNDAHPFNIVFDRNIARFVDIGSIRKRNSVAWVGREEFENCYIRPLKLIRKGYEFLYRCSFGIQGTGIPSREVISINNKIFSFIGLGLIEKIVKIKIMLQEDFDVVLNRVISRYNIKSYIFISLLRAVLKIGNGALSDPYNVRLRARLDKAVLARRSRWGKYHDEAGLLDANVGSLTPRFKWIVSCVEKLNPRSVVELAGNQGVLSSAIAKIPGVQRVLCTDYDLSAIDSLAISGERANGLYIAAFDFMYDERESLSGERSVRFKSDLVLALAVTHHLILTQGYSLSSICETIKSYTNKYAILEFMPLGLWDGKAAPPLPDWYTEEWFCAVVEKYFSILERKVLEENRVVFLCEKNTIKKFPMD